MFDAFLKFILRQKLLIALAAVLLLAAGAATWQRLPIDAFPDVTNVQVMILSQAPGLAPAEVERLVTIPIEAQMGGLPNVQQVRSLSRSGLSQVVVVFEDHVDAYFARQLVFERLTQARERLPEGVEPELGPISTGLGEIFQYAVESGYYCAEHVDTWSREPGQCPECRQPLVPSGYDLMGLRTLQDWVIAPHLRRLPGVNEVNSFGGFVKQYHVDVVPERLLKYRVSLAEVVTALERNNANAGGGYIVRDWEQIDIVSYGLIEDLDDIACIVVKAEDGTPVYLKDVAEVRVGHQTRHGVVTKDGRGEAVVGMTIMLKGANSRTVVDRVKAALAALQPTLPRGVRIIPFYDRTDLIEACVNTMAGALVQGAILVVAVLFFLLWDLRAALAAAISLPVTAATAFLLMGWQGVTANLMSLGGLAIAMGMVVDGSIVVTENIARHMQEHAASPRSRMEIAFGAIREVARPVVFAALIIIVVFLPLLALESMEGKMFRPLALTMGFAMIGAVAASMTVVPVLAAVAVKRATPAQSRANPLQRAVWAAYAPLLQLAMRGAWITVAVAAAVLAGTVSVVPRLGTEFLPPLDEGALAVNVVRLPTAGSEGAALQTTAIERRLLQLVPEVASVVSKTGRAEIAEDPMGPEQSDLLITFKPRRHWRPGLTKAALVREIERELAAFPGIRPAFSQPIALRVNELISGIKSDVAIKVFGEDLGVLRSTAERIAPILASVEGASDVKIEQLSGFTQLEVRMDRAAMARHKINAADINDLVETAVRGKTATTVFEGQKRFEAVVRYPAQDRQDEMALARLLVPSPDGYHVPLGQLARLGYVEAPAQINREDGLRRVVIEANVRGRDIGGFVAEARARLAGLQRDLPTGYRLVWGGQFENQQRAMARLSVIVPVALLLIFLMLYMSLGSLKSALLVLTNLPFALVGGVLAIYWLGANLSVSAAIGFIVLWGVAVENGLVLVQFFDQLRAEGRTVQTAVVEACRRRVRPLMMTTLTTLLGLLPILYATGPGSEIQKPLVAVVFGGLVSSWALTLLILPVLYVLCQGRRAAAAGA